MAGNNYTQSMDIGDLISRGWHLYRSNFRLVFLYVLIPGILVCIAKLCMNVPYVLTGLNDAYAGAICCLCPMGIVIWILSVFLTILFSWALIKSLYHSLIGLPADIKTIMNLFKQNFGKILLFSGIVTCEALAFIILDWNILFLSYVLSVIPVGIAGIMAETNQFGAGIGCLCSSLICIFFIILIITIFCLQFLVCILQMVIFASDKSSISASLGKSFQVLLKFPLRSIFFGICLGLFFLFLTMFFQYKGLLLVVLGLLNFTSISEELKAGIIMVSSSVWFSIVNMFMWPLILSSITLFYFDIRIRSEGLDLKQMLSKNKSD